MAGAATCKIMLNLVIRLQRLPNFRWLTSDEKDIQEEKLWKQRKTFSNIQRFLIRLFFSATVIAQRTINYKKIFNNGTLAAVTHTSKDLD